MATIQDLVTAIQTADAIVVGAGSGMSTAAGFDFWYQNSPLFSKYFQSYADKYGFTGAFNGFYTNFDSQGERWGFALQALQLMYHEPAPKPTYDLLKQLIIQKPYHIVTTNQDMVFKRYFPTEKISEIQGSWSYYQSTNPTTDQHLYDTKKFLTDLSPHINGLALPDYLIPTSQVDGAPLEVWARGPRFLEGARYQQEHDKWTNFLAQHQHEQLLLLELGVGRMTPMFIQEPFWALTNYLPNATYVSINPQDALTHPSIQNQSLLFNQDIHDVLTQAVNLTEEL